MQNKTLSKSALAVILDYSHFRIGSAVCNVPYFNNKTVRSRAALRALIGKGTPAELKDEVMNLIVKMHVDKDLLADEMLKKILVDNNLGIECSGFAYHVLDAESRARNSGSSISSKLSFANCQGIFSRIRCAMRPAENCSVRTFALDQNSYPINVAEIEPGDMITILAYEKSGYSNDTLSDIPDRDHVLIIDSVEYKDGKAISLTYSHSIAYPEDGIYGTGIRQGTISLVRDETASDSSSTIPKITDFVWKENGKNGKDNPLFMRAQKSLTQIRRLKALKA